MKRISKLLSVVLVLALLLPLVSAAPQSPTANLQRSGELADGVYTLQSVADGKTLNTFNMEYTAGGYAYTDSIGSTEYKCFTAADGYRIGRYKGKICRRKERYCTGKVCCYG